MDIVRLFNIVEYELEYEKQLKIIEQATKLNFKKCYDFDSNSKNRLLQQMNGLEFGFLFLLNLIYFNFENLVMINRLYVIVNKKDFS